MAIIYLKDVWSHDSLDDELIDTLKKRFDDDVVITPILHPYPKTALNRLVGIMNQIFTGSSDNIFVARGISAFYALLLHSDYGVETILIDPVVKPWQAPDRIIQFEGQPYWLRPEDRGRFRNLLESRSLSEDRYSPSWHSLNGINILISDKDDLCLLQANQFFEDLRHKKRTGLNREEIVEGVLKLISDKTG